MIVDETDCTVADTAVVWEVIDLTVVSAVVPTVADAAVVLVVWAAVVDAAVVSDEVVSTVWTAVVDAAVGGCVGPRSTVNIFNVIKDFKFVKLSKDQHTCSAKNQDLYNPVIASSKK